MDSSTGKNGRIVTGDIIVEAPNRTLGENGAAWWSESKDEEAQ